MRWGVVNVHAVVVGDDVCGECTPNTVRIPCLSIQMLLSLSLTAGVSSLADSVGTRASVSSCTVLFSQPSLQEGSLIVDHVAALGRRGELMAVVAPVT